MNFIADYLSRRLECRFIETSEPVARSRHARRKIRHACSTSCNHCYLLVCIERNCKRKRSARALLLSWHDLEEAAAAG
jgi:hypothetical protein